jgi:hypothetical protein
MLNVSLKISRKHLSGNHSSKASANKNPDRVEGDYCDDRDDHDGI